MVPADLSVSKQRSERRISVRLPLKVRGRDSRGVTFEEETSSENLCRNGAAFVTRFDVGHWLRPGDPHPVFALRVAPQPAYRPNGKGFATCGRVVHVAEAQQPAST